MSKFDSIFSHIKTKRDALGHWRQLPETTRTLVADFSHNDYLGLAHDSMIAHAAHEAAKEYGIGSTGSRLLSGNRPIHQLLEQTIATSKQTETALIFNSGYQANATVLAALIDKKILGAEPLVFSDRLNHASLHHACQLMGVKQIRYHHNDLDHLQRLLTQHVTDPRPKFIVTETVFGMDGDSVNMDMLTQLADQFNAFLYLDEAHATGIFGPHGYGLASGLIGTRGVAMGTFSKALGGSGAYIACSQVVRDYLLNCCPGFIYSTALSPALVGSAYAAWSRLPTMDAQRTILLTNANHLRTRLQALGFDTGHSTSHIVPILIGDTQTALKLQAYLLNQGLLVSIIRPPTVPNHTTRLRIALSVSHPIQQIDALICALSTVPDTVGLKQRPITTSSKPGTSI